jgi:hypothetical protein
MPEDPGERNHPCWGLVVMRGTADWSGTGRVAWHTGAGPLRARPRGLRPMRAHLHVSYKQKFKAVPSWYTVPVQRAQRVFEYNRLAIEYP